MCQIWISPGLIIIIFQFGIPNEQWADDGDVKRQLMLTIKLGPLLIA